MSNPISPDHAAFDLPVLSSASVSPDERHILYVLTLGDRETQKYDSQIWLADVEGSNRHRLTWTHPSNHSPVWSPAGDQIAYVSTGDGDGHHPHAINLLPLSGGEVRVLAYHGAPPDALAWSPDGATIAYSLAVDPNNPNETPRDAHAPAPVRITRRIDYKQDDYGYLNDVRSQIFVLDIASGKRRSLTSELRDHEHPTWSHNGKSLAVNLPSGNGMQGAIGLIDVLTREMEIIGNAHSETSAFAWSPDDTRLIILRDPFDYILYEIASKTVRPLTDDPGFEPDDTSDGIVWLDTSMALVHGFAQGSSVLYRLDVETGSLTEVSRWQAIHSGLHLFADGIRVLQTTTSINGEVGLATIDLASGEKTLLGNDAEAFFAESPAALWETLTIERGDVTIHGWLLKPADFDERQRYPVIIMVHGGPHMAHGYGIHPIAEVYATNGFVVLLVSPRGSTTYGRAFTDAVLGDWGNEDGHDLEAMLDRACERPYVDSGRAGIYGYSYGGYMTSWAIGQTQRFKVAVCGAPVFDLESFFGTSDIGHSFGPKEHGGTPWDEREHLLARSPSTHIHKAVTPTLIVHGEADERCPIGQGEQMFMSLKQNGVETEFARYPG